MANIHLPHPTTPNITISTSGSGYGAGSNVTFTGTGGAGGGTYYAPPPPDTITFKAADDQEILKVTKEGFYVRGVKVEADEKEAETVYKAFKRWMVESELRRPY